MDALEVVIEVEEIGAQVAAARLPPLQRAAGDRPGKRIGIGAQLRQLGSLSQRSRESPDRFPGLFGRRLESPLGRPRWFGGGTLAEGRGGGAAAEDEALAQRVGREPVGSV